MAVVNILAFCILILLLGFHYKEELVDVLPMAVCILTLVLYVLAFCRRLSAIDWIGTAVLLLSAVRFCMLKKAEKARLLSEAGEKMKHSGFIAMAVLLVGAAVLVNGRIATWWDDLNFWATDVKALYALDGFAAKYTNAASEFGDYPPGAQLIKWWFVHMNPKGFSEGLMFAGYYFSVFSFLAPLLRHLKGKNPVMAALAVVCLAAFPSVAEAFYCQGMCADLVMAVIYGAFLAAAADEEGHTEKFYYLRLALYLSVLVLIKSVGFLWDAFGLVFLWIWRRAVKKKGGSARALLLVTAAPVLTGGSWLLFCLLMRRVAKLTGAAVSIAAGNMPVLLPGTRKQLVKTFLEAFVFWPLHRSRTWAVDLSPLALFLIICLMIAFFLWRKILKKREAVFLGIFLPVSGLVFYAVDLVSHLTIFAAETQYLDPFGMVSSIERYGVPFTIGSLYLLAFLALERSAGSGRVYLLCFAFIFLTANWTQVYRCFFGYRAELAQEKENRAEMITPQSEIFLQKIGDMDVGKGARILYMKDAGDNQWVKNTYVAFEASPVSLIFGSVDIRTTNSGDMWNAMDLSHAGYLYLDGMKEETAVTELFAPFAENFRTGTLYKITNQNGEIHLEEIQNLTAEEEEND